MSMSIGTSIEEGGDISFEIGVGVGATTEGIQTTERGKGYDGRVLTWAENMLH